MNLLMSKNNIYYKFFLCIQSKYIRKIWNSISPISHIYHSIFPFPSHPYHSTNKKHPLFTKSFNCYSIPPWIFFLHRYYIYETFFKRIYIFLASDDKIFLFLIHTLNFFSQHISIFFFYKFHLQFFFLLLVLSYKFCKFTNKKIFFSQLGFTKYQIKIWSLKFCEIYHHSAFNSK